MSYHSIIREQAGIPLEKSETQLQKEELLKQVQELSRATHVQWLAEEPTVEFFKSISNQIDDLESRARTAACLYHINNNHQEVIKLLIQAEQLREIKQKYGSVRHN